MNELIQEMVYVAKNYASCLHCRELIRGAEYDRLSKMGHALCGIKFLSTEK